MPFLRWPVAVRRSLRTCRRRARHERPRKARCLTGRQGRRRVGKKPMPRRSVSSLPGVYEPHAPKELRQGFRCHYRLVQGLRFFGSMHMSLNASFASRKEAGSIVRARRTSPTPSPVSHTSNEWSEARVSHGNGSRRASGQTSPGPPSLSSSSRRSGSYSISPALGSTDLHPHSPRSYNCVVRTRTNGRRSLLGGGSAGGNPAVSRSAAGSGVRVKDVFFARVAANLGIDGRRQKKVLEANTAPGTLTPPAAAPRLPGAAYMRELLRGAVSRSSPTTVSGCLPQSLSAACAIERERVLARRHPSRPSFCNLGYS